MLDTGSWVCERDAGTECGTLERLIMHVEESSESGYRRLDVYQAAHLLGVEIHHLSLRLPRYELYETGSQMRRASKSISANIVEGYGRRRYKAEFVKHLIYAQASCDETFEWLTYVIECHPDVGETAVEIRRTADSVGRRLNRFLRSIEAGHNKAEASS